MDKLKNMHSVMLGADPELFLTRDGRIIGSEKIMPKGGVIYSHGITNLNVPDMGTNKVIMDGIQIELNPMPAKCREALARNIQVCFQNINTRLTEQKDGEPRFKDVKLDFSPLVEITKEELDSLGADSRRFGCVPSLNVYEKRDVGVDPEKYLFRSAGGHIHIGHLNTPELVKALKDDKKMVRLLDVIVGNTCVLLDRDMGNAERRKVYGRAGEYRLPPHGLEYRTLSNFWLRSYPLMGFVMGLTRFAVNVMANGDKYYDAFMDKIEIEDIKKAINENDFELAFKNFTKIEGVINEISDEKQYYNYLPLYASNMDNFKYFIKMGIDHYFKKENAMDRWINHNVGSGNGWENWIQDIK